LVPYIFAAASQNVSNTVGSPLAGKLFVVIGAGGAGKALAYGAKEKGARVVIANRTYGEVPVRSLSAIFCTCSCHFLFHDIISMQQWAAFCIFIWFWHLEPVSLMANLSSTDVSRIGSFFQGANTQLYWKN
jgi:hypothetical protein